MTNPLKLFLNFTISHLKMAGYEFLRTSRGGVIHRTIVFSFVRDIKRRTMMSLYSSSLKGSLCSFEQTCIHNHNNAADITKTVIKDVIVRLPNCQVTKLLVTKLLVTKMLVTILLVTNNSPID